MGAGLGGTSKFAFQYIPRVTKEESEVLSTRSRRVPLLSRKLEIFLLLGFVSGVALALWAVGLILWALCFLGFW